MPTSQTPGDTLAERYDAVPYVRRSYHYSHPGRLAVLARLFGLGPAPVDAARVLVLGCASGANVIPMAYALPGSSFVGVDLSARQIEEAQAFAAGVGLQNITLQQTDLRELTADQPFDYIIAHGVFSWIPPEQQPQLLATCARLLAPQGVVYLSYNTHPAGHLRQMVRQMALFHVRRFSDPAHKAAQTRGLLQFLVESMHPQGSAYQQVLKSELAVLEKMSDSGLLHEVLEEHNNPVHFWEMNQQAAAQGLKFLCESMLADMPGLAAEAERLSWLRDIADPLTREQYLDFISGRGFRRSLFCHADLSWDSDLSAEYVKSFQLQSSAKPVGPADGEVQLFRDRYGRQLPVSDPLSAAALAILGENYPQTLSFAELVEACHARLGISLPPHAEAQLMQLLMVGFVYEVVDLRCWNARTAVEVEPRPTVSRVARYQLEQGWELTTLLHEMYQPPDELARDLIGLLDGTRDEEALLAALDEKGHHVKAAVLERRLEELRLAALLEEPR